MCVKQTESFDECLRLEHDLDTAIRHVLCNLLIAMVEAPQEPDCPQPNFMPTSLTELNEIQQHFGCKDHLLILSCGCKLQHAERHIKRTQHQHGGNE